jgi:uncharacterized protein DUF6518
VAQIRNDPNATDGIQYTVTAESGIGLRDPGRLRWVWTAILAAVLAGVLLGGGNSLSNVLGSAYSPHALRPEEGIFSLEVLGAVLGTAWAWALVAFSIGWCSTTKWLASLMGTLALVVAAVVYYVSDFIFGLIDQFEIQEMAYWAAISLVVGPVMGLLGHLARFSEWWSLAPGLAAPVVISMTSQPSGSDHIQPWPQRVAWIIATCLAIAMALRWLSLRRSAVDRRPT